MNHADDQLRARLPAQARQAFARHQIRSLVLKYLSEIGGISPAKITENARFDQELEMKSIAFVELQVGLEDELDIEIDPLRVLELNQLEQVIDYLHGLVISKSARTDRT